MALKVCKLEKVIQYSSKSSQNNGSHRLNCILSLQSDKLKETDLAVVVLRDGERVRKMVQE